MARAFAIGKHESECVSNLMVNMVKPVVDALASAVRTRGMAKFITHECLAKDVLNTAFSSGVSGLEHWKDHLRNEGDGKLVSQPKDVLSSWLKLVINVVLCSFTLSAAHGQSACSKSSDCCFCDA